MTSVLLIYPFFKSRHDRSIFRFPPLGLGYLASSLRKCGYDVGLLDCTFLDKDEALKMATDAKADAVGIYSMVTMREQSLMFARHLRESCDLLIAGGPLPSCDPVSFLSDFDVAVVGEGEKTICEILRAHEQGSDLGSIKGIAYRQDGRDSFTPKRELEPDLDRIAFPARDLFPNQDYINHWKKRFGYAITTVMTTRGCPFCCEFCSNAVFGESYRERSPENVLDEVEEALSFGYDRIHFADDVFTLNRERMLRLCDEISSRRLNFKWECLGRADSIDLETAKAMKMAGCDRIFFGIESGNDSILRLMNKKITAEKARHAVEAAGSAGLRTGAFFILGYPGETDDTLLDTIRFATSLPVDYLSFTMPYPLPGTALCERVKGQVKGEWTANKSLVSDHSLTFEGDFSEAKIKFAILKGQLQFMVRRRWGKHSSIVLKPFEDLTDKIFRLIK
ncbi:MAG: radical SAM protein [Methanotrichaceae archaeon]|jgi:anaerobic magnesium-protoporphyrin IX monomethyl ester cyclase